MFTLDVADPGKLSESLTQQRYVAPDWYTRNVFNRKIPDADKEPILRAYLKRWRWEVGQFFGGVDATSSSDELRRIAPDHPISRVETDK
jgi:hypothetical protein